MIQLLQIPLGLEGLRADDRHIHEGDGLIPAPGVELVPQGKVTAAAFFEEAVRGFHPINLGEEGGVAAMIRPIGVDHADFGDGGVPAFGIPEVSLAEGQVVNIHGKAVIGHKTGPVSRRHGGEIQQGFHGGGHGIAHVQRFHPVKRGGAAFHRVYQMGAYFGEFHVGDFAVDEVDPGGGHGGAFLAGHNLDALGAGIGPLVVLAGQIFHGEHPASGLGQVFVGQVNLGFGEHRKPGLVKIGLVHALYVVAVDHPHALHAIQPQSGAQIVEHPFGFHGEFGLFLHIDAIYHPQHSSSIAWFLLHSILH